VTPTRHWSNQKVTQFLLPVFLIQIPFPPAAASFESFPFDSPLDLQLNYQGNNYIKDVSFSLAA
jgi:hypothetical protein